LKVAILRSYMKERTKTMYSLRSQTSHTYFEFSNSTVYSSYIFWDFKLHSI
jgi:hypothetical protein